MTARPSAVAPEPATGEKVTAAVAALTIVVLLGAVTLGYLYAVEAAATGGVALVLLRPRDAHARTRRPRDDPG